MTSKKYFFKPLFLLSFFLVFSFTSNALTRKQKRMLHRADNHLLFQEYAQALPLYANLLQSDSANAQLNYKTGICYFYSETENRKALHCFENAKKYFTADTISDLYYYLAKSYQRQNRFQEAISNYQLIKKMIKPSATVDLADVDSNISACKNGIVLMQNPKNVAIENMGADINSSFPDYAPVISADEATLIFTSKRKGTGGKIADDGLYYEDIYVSKKISGKDWLASQRLDSNADNFPKPKGLQKIFFSRAKNIGKAINTKYHDASIAISADGKKLLIYKDNSIWMSVSDNGIWGKPQKLDKNINQKNSYNPSACFSADEKTLFVVSDCKGGFGGKDIYQSTQQSDGSWSPLQNLGSEINTVLDEESPFISADGKTLYFSSQGHNSIGGFDVFKSSYENGKWQKPKNLGYPINSGGNDLFLTLNAAGTRGYYATQRADTYGGLDIYRIIFEPNKNNSNDSSLMALKKDSIDAVTQWKKDSTAKAMAANHPTIDSTTGSDAQKNNFSNTHFVYFDFDDSKINFSYDKKMDSIYNYLKTNKSPKIALDGYCDTKGTEAFNTNLSLKRAQAVKNFLVKKGISSKRISVFGKGSENPVAPNTNADGSDNPAGRAKNRRVEIRMIENK